MKQNERKYGTVRNNLEALLLRRGMSKNKLAHLAEMQRTQINKFCKNEVSRLDTDVLARICTALNCPIDELLEYVPPEGVEIIRTVSMQDFIAEQKKAVSDHLDNLLMEEVRQLNTEQKEYLISFLRAGRE